MYKINIKFEVYKKLDELGEPELYILDIIDIISTNNICSYNDYKHKIQQILSTPEILQRNIKNLNLCELEEEKLYYGEFLIKFSEAGNKFICYNWELKKFI